MQKQQHKEEKRDESISIETIDNKYYLLAIFDEIMNYCAEVNDKHTWMCKSMGMSKYHDMLLTMYGPERLRYIYLVRDPRDVTLSFMRTPVGDCHPYMVAKKWAKLQDHALYIKAKNPELLHEVKYEDVIKDKVTEVGKINDFIGQRRTGKVMRRGSVVVIKDEKNMTSDSRKSHEATKAAVLSYQFKNLTRGDSFTKKQFEKWRREMEDDDARIVEIVAKEQMNLLGYTCWFVDENSDEDFNEEEITSFENENKRLVEKMNNDLKMENPGDHERRVKQSTVLEFDADYIRSSFINKIVDLDIIDEMEDENQSETSSQDLNKYDNHDFRTWPKDASCFGFISEEEIEFAVTETNAFKLSYGRTINFAAASQTGYYPRQRGKKNQDSHLCGVLPSIQGESDEQGVLFGVFDGHGPCGTESSSFVRDIIKTDFEGKNEEANNLTIEDRFKAAYKNANYKLAGNEAIDSSQSGTTAISLYIEKDVFHVANVGDSRCIVIAKKNNSKDDLELNDYEIQVLSQDQTPEREDELSRLKSCGALIMTSEEFDAKSTQKSSGKLDDSEHIVCTTNEPLRIWASDGSKLPGKLHFDQNFGILGSTRNFPHFITLFFQSKRLCIFQINWR